MTSPLYRYYIAFSHPRGNGSIWFDMYGPDVSLETLTSWRERIAEKSAGVFTADDVVIMFWSLLDQVAPVKADHDVCIVLLPDRSRCGLPVEYVSTPSGAGETYTGWYHTDRSVTADHHAVPKRWI